MNKELYEKSEYALSLIKEGNDLGVDILYSSMGKVMLAIARGIVKDSFIAEDIVQESFLKIVQNINKYKLGTNGYSWVCKIVRNTALNSLKESNIGQVDVDEFYTI